MLKKLIIVLIEFYQMYISPRYPSSCRFIPTCSSYAKEAIEKYGVIKGGKLAVKRILKCHPGGPGGYDPVP